MKMNNEIPILIVIKYFSFFFLIIITTSHSQPQSYSNLSSCKNTNNSYNCGKLFNISYPFWGQNRHFHCGAGEPFHLNCHNNETTTILLASQNFTVIEINTQNHTVKLKRTDLSQNICSPQFDNTFLSPNVFQYLPIVKNITIFYNCTSLPGKSLCGTQNQAFCHVGGEDKVFDEISESRNCKKHIRVPAGEGFPLWSYYDGLVGLDDLKRGLNEGFEVNYSVNKECLKCLGSEKGDCKGDYIDKHVELCYYVDCPDGSIASSTHCHKKWLSTQRNINIILGSAGAISFVGLLISVITFCSKYKSTKNNQDIEAFLKTHEAFTLRRYKFSHIKKMTNNFKVKLGEGGYGTVYKGKLLNDCPVAIKILKASKGNGEEFINEVSSITKTSHVNVVTLLGFCFEGQKKALIYEFMSNGSLDKFIHNKELETIPSLSWEILYQIAKGIARGLEYLHRGCSTRILHFDIKPHNILLDENFCPKISDFGLSRLCTKKESIISMSNARGTIGYVAPELCNRNFGGVSHKSDVYSYGMMLLEMVGGRENINADASHTSEIYFPHWIYKKLDLGNDLRSDEVIAIEEEEEEEEEDEIARRMTIVGLWCIQTFPNDRPSMSKVIDMLEGNMSSLKIPPKPVLSSPTRTVPESLDS